MEYAILLAIVAAAIMGMQVYAKRGIQAGIKMASDTIGSQHEGMADIDLNLIWKFKGQAQVDATTDKTQTIKTATGGQVARETDETTKRTGTLSLNLFASPDQ